MFKVGDKVTLVPGSKWHKINNVRPGTRGVIIDPDKLSAGDSNTMFDNNTLFYDYYVEWENKKLKCYNEEDLQLDKNQLILERLCN